MDKAKFREGLQKYSMIIVLVLVTLFFTWGTKGKILYPQNITNLISQNAYVYVLATGMLLCILTGGNIDLAVGSVVCFVGAVGGILMEKMGMPMPVAVILMLLLGIAIGAWQAVWIAYVHVPPFITTLSGMLVFRGWSNVVLGGQTLPIKNQSFIVLFGGGANCYVPDILGGGEGMNRLALVVGVAACVIFVVTTMRGYLNRKKKGYETGNTAAMYIKMILICAVIMFITVKLSQYKGIPTSLVWVLIVALIYGYITSKTTIGRYFYAVGGNIEAARLSGIRTSRVKYLVFALSGFFAGLAGIVLLSRTNSSQGSAGLGYEFKVITCVVLGGVSVAGGSGRMSGVVAGTFIIGALNNGMVLMNINTWIQDIVLGIVLVLAVGFDCIQKKRQAN